MVDCWPEIFGQAENGRSDAYQVRLQAEGGAGGIAIAAAVTAIVAVFVVQASAASASTSWSGGHDFRDDASVAVRLFLTENGKIWWHDADWRQLC